MLPVTGSLALEEDLVAEAIVSTTGVGAAAAGAFVFARRGRKQAAHLERETVAQLGDPPPTT